MAGSNPTGASAWAAGLQNAMASGDIRKVCLRIFGE